MTPVIEANDYLWAFGAALATTLALTPFVRHVATRSGAVDDPTRDDRRIHTKTVPRWGGFAIVFGIGAGMIAGLWGLKWLELSMAAAIGTSLILAIGAADDLLQFNAKIQALSLVVLGVAVQFAAQLQIARVGVLGIELAWFAVPFTAVYLFIITKTMDTIDGVDGLCAGLAAIAAITLGLCAHFLGGIPQVIVCCAAVLGAAIGFLRYNWNPASIIMGTGGAQGFGFLLACLSIVVGRAAPPLIAFWLPFLVFGVQLLDAVQVVIRRRRAGVPITQADKRHLHHLLLERGYSQRQTVMILYGVSAVLGAGLVTWVAQHG